MKIFKINEKLSIVCESQGTRYGFRHIARLMVNGIDNNMTAKCCYYNRTWESFEFQTVILNLLDKICPIYISIEEKEKFISEI
jgi:hypothetical protein